MAPKRIKEELMIFLRLADLTATVYPEWKDFYRLCAQGKFPTRVKLVERSLVFRRGPRPAIFQLPLEASIDELDRCNRFFREEVGLTIGQAAPVQPNVDTTPLIKRIQRLKKLRNIQLLLYTKMVAERDGLSPVEREQLFSVIALGWLSGLVSIRSLQIETDENGIERIVNITGIQRDSTGKFFINAPPQKVRVRGTVAQSKPRNTIHDQWLAYTNRVKPGRNVHRETEIDETDDVDSTSQSDW